MNTNERLYLDYNATSPLSSNLEKLLVSGDFLFANPSSQHTSGKQAQKAISKVQSNLFKHFNLRDKEFHLFFHSGATEAINTFFNLNKGDHFFYFKSDHPCVHAVANSLKARGVQTKLLDISEDGQIDIDDCIREINKVELTENSWINYTYMHNETGVVWPLDLAVELKSKTNIKVHVDAVQSVGKTDLYNKLDHALDAYTYSGHKFGALKGIGFSFYNVNIDVVPLILGGGQQGGVRSGTVNVHGIISLDSAIRELDSNKNFQKIKELKNKIELELDTNSRIQIIRNQSNNTICFVHEKIRADVMLIHFDLLGMDVSSGSACSSGNVKASSTLLAMGYKDRAANNIRISLGKANIVQGTKILSKIKEVIAKL